MKSIILENIKNLIKDINYRYTYDLSDLQKIIYVAIKRIMDFSLSKAIILDQLFYFISNNSETLPIEFFQKYLINEVNKFFTKFEIEIFTKYIDYDRNNILYREDVENLIIIYIKGLVTDNDSKIETGRENHFSDNRDEV